MRSHFSFRSLSVVALCLIGTIGTLANAYYYNDLDLNEDGSEGFSRSLYTRSVKSPPSPARQSYAPPPPARARPAIKGFERTEQQTYERQQAVPMIQHDVVGRPEPYNFNFDVKDDYGNNQYRREESDDTGAVRGSYGYTDANGLYRIVDYVADEDGFRATIRSNEPGFTEPHPVTGEVESPADVQLTAEATPARVREQQQNYARQSGGGGGGSSSYGGGSSLSSSASPSSYGSSSGSSGGYQPQQQIQQQRLRSGDKY